MPGAAPIEVETLVTRPVEEAASVVPGLRRVTSRSRAGSSEVTLEFVWDTNMDFAGLDVREKLDGVLLPEDAERPRLLRFDPASDAIIRLGGLRRPPALDHPAVDGGGPQEGPRRGGRGGGGADRGGA